MRHTAAPDSGDDLGGAGCRERSDVVDHRRAAREHLAHHLGSRGVHGDRHREAGQPVEHRQDARELLVDSVPAPRPGGSTRRRCRPGPRLRRRAVARAPRCPGVRVPSAVEERVGRDVDDTHHERPVEHERVVAAVQDGGHRETHRILTHIGSASDAHETQPLLDEWHLLRTARRGRNDRTQAVDSAGDLGAQR